MYSPDRLTLTPRGADLVATAKHVDLDALTADDEPVSFELARLDCFICKGRGRVPVFQTPTRTISDLLEGASAPMPEQLQGWDVTCEPCSGSGKVRPAPLVEFTYAASFVADLAEAEWLDLRASGVIEKLEGRRVEIQGG